MGEIIAVIVGTILGAALTWITNWLSQKGKVSVNKEKWDCDFYIYNGYGQKVKIKNINYNDKSSFFEYSIRLFIYNSSGIVRPLRNIKVGFNNNKEVVTSSIPKDFATIHYSDNSSHMEAIGLINLNPNCGIELNLTGIVKKENMLSLKKVNKIYLSYTDLNKCKSLLLDDVDFSKYFDKEKNSH